MTRDEFTEIYDKMNGIWKNEEKSKTQFDQYFFALKKYDKRDIEKVIVELRDVKSYWPPIPVLHQIHGDIRAAELRERKKNEPLEPATIKQIDQSRKNAAKLCKKMLDMDEAGEILKCGTKDSMKSIGECTVDWLKHLANSTTDFSKPMKAAK